MPIFVYFDIVVYKEQKKSCEFVSLFLFTKNLDILCLFWSCLKITLLNSAVCCQDSFVYVFDGSSVFIFQKGKVMM